MNRELQMLSAVRRRGQSPDLPVFVTDMQRFQRNMEGVGVLVIWAPLHERHDWRALAGLEVYVMLQRGYSDAGSRLIESVREARPRRLWIWNGERCDRLDA